MTEESLKQLLYSINSDPYNERQQLIEELMQEATQAGHGTPSQMLDFLLHRVKKIKIIRGELGGY